MRRMAVEFMLGPGDRHGVKLMKLSTFAVLATFAMAFQLAPTFASAQDVATRQSSTVASRLPDGGVYTDADIALQTPGSTPSTVRKVVDEGWLAATQHRESAVELNFARARKLAPNDRFMLWSYGWAQLNLGHPQQALAAFRRNLALRPDLRPDWLPMAMALTLTEANDLVAARAWYRAAAASDPVRWGSDAAAMRHTQRYTARERALLRRLIAKSDIASDAAAL